MKPYYILFIAFVFVLVRSIRPIEHLYFLIIPVFIYVLYVSKPLLFKKNPINFVLLLFSLFATWAFLSSFWSLFPFNTMIRAAYFEFIMLGGILLGYWVANDSDKLLNTLLIVSIIFICFNFAELIFNWPLEAWKGGNNMGFKGIHIHQNTLGFICLFCALPLLIIIFSKGRSKGMRYFVIFSFMLNIALLYYSSSRGAALAFIVMIAVFFIMQLKSQRSIIFIGISLLFIVVAYNYQPLQSYTNKFVYKWGPDFLFSRRAVIDGSIRAAKKGGVFGLGYGVSDPEIIPDSNAYLVALKEDKIFEREKSISTLGLIEEVGIIGTLLFFLPIAFIYYSIFSKYRLFPPNNRIILYGFVAYFTALIVHAQIEAWWIGVGSIKLPIYFIFFGIILKMTELFELHQIE